MVMSKRRKQDATPPVAKINRDGAQNILTGLGMRGRDSAVSTVFTANKLLTQVELEGAYSSSGIARRIVDLIVDDALGNRVESDAKLYDEFTRLDMFKKVGELARLSRLHGGAIMLMITQDGIEDMAMPLNENNLQRVDKLVVFDRWEVQVLNTDFDNNPTSDTYGEIMQYTIRPRIGTPLIVHHSRVIRMDGDYLPRQMRQHNQDWHASALQAAYQGFLNYMTAQGFIPSVMKEFSLTVFKLKGLFAAYAEGNEASIAKRVNDMQVSKSNTNGIFIDADQEEFIREYASVGGYAELVDKEMELLCADSGIPMTKLFGRSPQGMNATGDGDADVWYKNVERYQTLELEPVINRIVQLLEIQTLWTDKPDAFEWEWPSLHPMSELELAEVRLKSAQADKIYAVDMQAVDPEYLFHARHDGGFSTELGYNEESLSTFMEGRETVEPVEPIAPVEAVNEND